MRWRLSVAVFLLFAAVVIARWPATTVVSRLPATLGCSDVRGTIWRGVCGSLVFQGQRLGELHWRLRVWPLLTGRVATHLKLRGAGIDVDGNVLRERSGALQLTTLNTQADLAVLAPVLRAAGARVPEGFGGALRGRIDELRLSPTAAINFVKAAMDINGLRQLAAPGALGSWTVTFDGVQNATGEPVGSVVDRGGPFDFQGTIRLTNAPGYVVEGALAARPGVPPEVLNALRFLGGATDANGRRPFALEGGF